MKTSRRVGEPFAEPGYSRRVFLPKTTTRRQTGVDHATRTHARNPYGRPFLTPIFSDKRGDNALVTLTLKPVAETQSF